LSSLLAAVSFADISFIILRTVSTEHEVFKSLLTSAVAGLKNKKLWLSTSVLRTYHEALIKKRLKG
jgi:hypothetical protein